MSYGVALRNGIPFTLGTIAALCVNATGQAWSPAALWPTGTEPGMWIDPSNLTSQWQDSAGTTPVSTPGTVADSSNPVGLALDLRLGATALTDPGNHLFQATSTARPLLSAYDGQTLGPGNTYDATGYPIYQKYDGTDDGMATATFAAGTLTSAMDCMIAVRRDSNAVLYGVVGMQNQPQQVCFGIYDESASYPCFFGCGTPTVWVDGVQLPAGSRGELYTALPVGDWHILEFRGLDLSAWTRATFGEWGGGIICNGGQGGILLFPSSTPTADRDAARTWLGAKVGLTL